MENDKDFDNIMDVCRLCLKNENLIWIFDQRLDKLSTNTCDNMRQVVEFVTGISITQSDNITQKICLSCLQHVWKTMESYALWTMNTDELKKRRLKFEASISIKNIYEEYPKIILPLSITKLNILPDVRLDRNAIKRWEKRRKRSCSMTAVLSEKTDSPPILTRENIDVINEAKRIKLCDTPPKLVRQVWDTPKKNESNDTYDSNDLLKLNVTKSLFICDICNAISYNAKELSKHKRKHMRCNLCKCKFRSFEETSEHTNKKCLRKKMMNNLPIVKLERCDNSSLESDRRDTINSSEIISISLLSDEDDSEKSDRIRKDAEEELIEVVERIENKSESTKPKIEIKGDDVLNVNFENDDIDLLKSILEEKRKKFKDSSTLTDIPSKDDIIRSITTDDKLFELKNLRKYLEYYIIPVRLSFQPNYSLNFVADSSYIKKTQDKLNDSSKKQEIPKKTSTPPTVETSNLEEKNKKSSKDGPNVIINDIAIVKKKNVEKSVADNNPKKKVAKKSRKEDEVRRKPWYEYGKKPTSSEANSKKIDEKTTASTKISEVILEKPVSTVAEKPGYNEPIANNKTPNVKINENSLGGWLKLYWDKIDKTSGGDKSNGVSSQSVIPKPTGSNTVPVSNEIIPSSTPNPVQPVILNYEIFSKTPVTHIGENSKKNLQTGSSEVANKVTGNSQSQTVKSGSVTQSGQVGLLSRNIQTVATQNGVLRTYLGDNVKKNSSKIQDTRTELNKVQSGNTKITSGKQSGDVGLVSRNVQNGGIPYVQSGILNVNTQTGILSRGIPTGYVQTGNLRTTGILKNGYVQSGFVQSGNQASYFSGYNIPTTNLQNGIIQTQNVQTEIVKTRYITNFIQTNNVNNAMLPVPFPQYYKNSKTSRSEAIEIATAIQNIPGVQPDVIMTKSVDNNNEKNNDHDYVPIIRVRKDLC